VFLRHKNNAANILGNAIGDTPRVLCDILDKAANILDKAIGDKQSGSQE
jgi:hypothetical protein